jgi:hypothetical protein
MSWEITFGLKSSRIAIRAQEDKALLFSCLMSFWRLQPYRRLGGISDRRQ